MTAMTPVDGLNIKYSVGCNNYVFRLKKKRECKCYIYLNEAKTKTGVHINDVQFRSELVKQSKR